MEKFDKAYRTPNYFGDPHAELAHFFGQINRRGTLLDLGCGQGRNALPLAKMGFSVTGIDRSANGISCMLEQAQKENIKLEGLVADYLTFQPSTPFDYFLLDAVIYAMDNESEEQQLIQRLAGWSQKDAMAVVVTAVSSHREHKIDQWFLQTGKWEKSRVEYWPVLAERKEEELPAFTLKSFALR